MRELINKVRKLVSVELERANTIHPPRFNSMHEAYAVILKEYEELADEFEKLESPMGGLWHSIKGDMFERATSWTELIEMRAELIAAEAIQVSAMCRKARM